MPELSPSSSPSSEISPKGKSKGKSIGKSNGKKAWNVILILAVIIATSLFIYAEQNRRSTAQQLEATVKQLEEIKSASQSNGEGLSDEILDKVNDLVDIPLDPKPLVATINDIDRLKESNDFFDVAKNGDFLILTGTRALLYDPDRNIVLDVAPFSVKQESPSPSPTAGSQ